MPISHRGRYRLGSTRTFRRFPSEKKAVMADSSGVGNTYQDSQTHGVSKCAETLMRCNPEILNSTDLSGN